MEWGKPVLVFVYGYGACFITLTTIMFSIIITRKLIEWMHERFSKGKSPASV